MMKYLIIGLMAGMIMVSTAQATEWTDGCKAKCENGKCNTVLGRTIWANDTDNKCKPVEEAKSLKKAFTIEKVKDDKLYDFEVVDFNYTCITLIPKTTEYNTDIPLKVNDVEIGTVKYASVLSRVKTITICSETDGDLFIKDEDTKAAWTDQREWPETTLAMSFTFGKASTTIQIGTADTGVLNDAFTTGANPNFNYTSYNMTSSYVSASLPLSSTGSDWDTHSSNLSSKIIALQDTSFLPYSPTSRFNSNITNVRCNITSCGSATTVTAKVWDKNTKTEVFSGQTKSCSTGDFSVNLGFLSPNATINYIFGIEADDNITTSLDSLGESRTYYLSGGSGWYNKTSSALRAFEVYYSIGNAISFVQFNTSDIIEESDTIESIIFSLYTTSSWTTQNSSVHEAYGEWDENTILNSTLSINSTILNKSIMPSAARWDVAINMSLSTFDYADSKMTYAIMSQSSNSLFQPYFWTKEYATTTRRPYLNITYSEGGEPPSGNCWTESSGKLAIPPDCKYYVAPGSREEVMP